MDDRELRHWGVKGMKWGVRRYQNKDGTLTKAGKNRYERESKEQGYKDYDESSGKYYKVKNKKGQREYYDFDPNEYSKKDMQRAQRLANESSGMANKLKNINDNAIKNRPKAKMDLSNMTDKEMRDQINRAILERQYNDMFAPQTVSKGREYTSKILDHAGSVLGVASSALGVALAIKELRLRG